MAGYAAVVSLKQTIERILKSCRFELVPPSSEIIRLACRPLEPLLETLKRLNSSSFNKSRKKLNSLDGGIKEAVWRFEDLLESHLSHQINLTQSDHRDVLFSIDLQGLQRDVDSFIETLKDMREEYIYELLNMPELEEDELVSSTNDFDGLKSKMVGFSINFEGAMRYLLRETNENNFCSLVGMPGSGKTTLAKKVFADAETLRFFEHRAWVAVGRKSGFDEIAHAILAQLDGPNMNRIGDDEKIGEKLKERLKGKRCLIVLDNVWDTQAFDYLASSLPDENIRILLTTNLIKVAHHISAVTMNMWPLNEEESVDLLRERVFGEEDVPPKLEKAATKIANKCNGLPLMIVTVAHLLSKANNYDPQFWNEVAERPNSALMIDAHNQISKVLFPVYDCSPQHLKMIYLYIGAFPRDYEIPESKLINLLAAEGFIEGLTLENFYHTCLDGLLTKNEIIIFKSKTAAHFGIKSYRLNPSWSYLFNGEALNNKFLHVLNSFDDLEKNIKGQRRLCLHTNFLFSFKQVYNFVKCNGASTARSLLCFGPYHQYSIPLDVGFKLLRVLDALKVRFYIFAVEILEQVQLQYLALTYNGELPTSISKLFNLQFLIIHPHLSLRSCGAPSYLPVQIWDMQELKHIEILGSNLPNPTSAASLQKLSTLVGVSANNCTKEIFERIPNIRKLGIQIELTPDDDDDSKPLSCFDHISELEKLDTLKCSIVNPEIMYGRGLVAPLSVSMFPYTLRKLHLSGLGYPWKYMDFIGFLPNLEVLKLRCYAFQGPKWETKRASFLWLEYLLIEDSDLVQWIPGSGSFRELRKLRIKHCYQLEELHWPSSHSGRIELVDCNPLAFTCAKQLKPGKKYQSIGVNASFDDVKLK